jgi:hypothetical protein
VDALDGVPVDNQVAAASITNPDRYIGTVSDDQTAFEFAAEVDTGEFYIFAVPLKNASDQDMVVRLTLEHPYPDVKVEVMSGSSVSGDFVDNMTRTGLNTWKFDLHKGADKTDPSTGDYEDSIVIVVAGNDTALPGFYTITAKLEQIGY